MEEKVSANARWPTQEDNSVQRASLSSATLWRKHTMILCTPPREGLQRDRRRASRMLRFFGCRISAPLKRRRLRTAIVEQPTNGGWWNAPVELKVHD